MVLPKSFYIRENVVEIAQELLGKVLYTHIGGEITAGIITETEAYAGITDKASHAYGGRRTARTEIMYAEGGVSYVYFTYGMHYLFNVITNKKEIPHAVLIRGIYPFIGTEIMLKRTGKQKAGKNLTNGPAKLTKALGITKAQNGLSLLTREEIWIEDHGLKAEPANIVASPRIGIDYAGEDALLPYRFNLVNVHFSSDETSSI
jgi:DNA-3-methyladenine glycosylase